ncbi:hypothetical protein K1T71_005447 [Dendrolimus kikuchii]|uniref:Uncharacterized protein n=1 Tax=Dendrolimus kikuchii TaxID=765133 RepID=A0ACC1D5I5_9NEOP|nr:hypothetical protein K1T71_005447 [Dendrolimus kikuchii]
MKILCELFVICLFNLAYVKADCGIVSKKEWDALSPLHVEYLPRPVPIVIIEHTVTDACNTDAACVNIVQNIQNSHLDINYWDIGPNFLVGGNGKIYEGSGWLHVGAHAYGYNRRSIGISFIGNYNNVAPTPQQMNAVKSMIQCGVERGHLSPNYHLVAHKQLIATESPGRKLYNEIRRWPHYLEDVSILKN